MWELLILGTAPDRAVIPKGTAHGSRALPNITPYQRSF